MAERTPKSDWSRRTFLAASTTGTLGIAGCLDLLGDDDSVPDPSYDDPLIPDGPSVELELVADGFTYPTDLVEIPDGSGTLLVTDQPGTIYSIDKETGDTTVAADLTDSVVDVYGGFSERGLIGIACHPDFASNGRVFVRYSAPSSATDLSTASHAEVLTELVADGDTIDVTTERELLRIPQPHTIHQGGKVLFGPDGYLYLTIGDGGHTFGHLESSWYDDNPGMGIHSQTTTDNLLGSVLRIDVDDEGEDTPYAIPDDNPLVDLEGHRDEYYAWGFRNPYGASFDGDDLYVADVGQALFEIVNLVEKGGNYGWNIREGTHCYDQDNANNPPADCPDATPADVRGGEELLDPLIEYPQYHPTGPPHSGEFDGSHQYGSAVIGGFVHRGSIDYLEGVYVFGDWSATPHGDPNGQLFIARPRAELDQVHEYFEELDLWGIERLRVRSNDDIAEDERLKRYVAGFGRDLDGEVYTLVTGTNEVVGETGEVRRLTDDGS